MPTTICRKRTGLYLLWRSAIDSVRVSGDRTLIKATELRSTPANEIRDLRGFPLSSYSHAKLARWVCFPSSMAIPRCDAGLPNGGARSAWSSRLSKSGLRARSRRRNATWPDVAQLTLELSGRTRKFSTFPSKYHYYALVPNGGSEAPVPCRFPTPPPGCPNVACLFFGRFSSSFMDDLCYDRGSEA